MKIDTDTKDMIRTRADERAAAAGMRFDPERAAFVLDWIQTHCRLYEGDHAGEPMVLMPWQAEFFSRLFGWVRKSRERGGWVRRFTRAGLWAAKKSGKSPTAAALGLYLLCADGESGQKVYTAAKNGDQARIAQRHAFEMVKQSPTLLADCKLHGSTLQIAHLPTNSVMMILTGDDTRGAKAKEGLNGSVLFDEMHVVDREILERVSRAGISRREPIQVSFSTAGDDPSSCGFERCQYGRQVNAGELDDLQFLHVEYAAPQKATDAQIEEHLDEYGRRANPAWGYIVQPDEFRQDWQTSKASPRETARFRQYRLNVWVGSTNQWLSTAGWELGAREYTLADLTGRECFLGLDLSRTRDMTAAVLAFPWPEDGPECVRLWPMFWLPEDTARERDHLFPFRSWARDEAIRLTSGGVVDYRVVEDDILAAVRDHDIRVRMLYFDQHYAEEITQRLADEIGCERMAVPQTLMTLSPLAKEFERRLSAGVIHHPGNAVMTWQVGHCTVWADRNQNVRPVKPSPLSGKSIDGIMATLDAMAGVVSNPVADNVNVYDTRLPLII